MYKFVPIELVKQDSTALEIHQKGCFGLITKENYTENYL